MDKVDALFLLSGILVIAATGCFVEATRLRRVREAAERRYEFTYSSDDDFPAFTVSTNSRGVAEVTDSHGRTWTISQIREITK